MVQISERQFHVPDVSIIGQSKTANFIKVLQAGINTRLMHNEYPFDISPDVTGPLEVDGIYGPLTRAALEEALAFIKDDNTATADDPPWLTIAKDEFGIRELPGSEHNQRILQYHQATSLAATADEVSWCSSFVNWVIREAGFQHTNSAVARSWLTWGRPVPPSLGCIVVLKRGNHRWQGHVGFLVKMSEDRVLVLGGNQSDEVTEAWYRLSDVIDYRWPATSVQPVPFKLT